MPTEDVKGILERQWSNKKRYLADREGGGHEAVMTARTKYGFVKFRVCGGLLYGRFPQKLKWAVYKSYVMPAILYASECMLPDRK